MSLALDSCQWTLLGNNFTEECSGWSWDHLQWTLSEDCSHDLLANAILQEHQCFLSDSKKVSWISDALSVHFRCAFDALLMRFLAALHKPYLRLHPVNFTWNWLHALSYAKQLRCINASPRGMGGRAKRKRRLWRWNCCWFSFFWTHLNLTLEMIMAMLKKWIEFMRDVG